MVSGFKTSPLDISRIFLRQSTVGNKEGRVPKVTALLSQCARNQWISTQMLESVRGKLNYIDAQIFGRVGRSVTEVLSRKHGTGSGKSFSDEDLSDIIWLVAWLEDATPRPLTPSNQGPPLLLFTDGACEPTLEGRLTTCGAVLLDRRDMKALCFGVEVSKALQKEWSDLAGGKNQLVTEAELLPLLLARKLWENRLNNSKLLVFVDSNPARFACIKGLQMFCLAGILLGRYLSSTLLTSCGPGIAGSHPNQTWQMDRPECSFLRLYWTSLLNFAYLINRSPSRMACGNRKG